MPPTPDQLERRVPADSHTGAKRPPRWTGVDGGRRKRRPQELVADRALARVRLDARQLFAAQPPLDEAEDDIFAETLHCRGPGRAMMLDGPVACYREAMSLLVAAYASAAAPTGMLNPPDLESRLAALHARGLAAHPALQLGGAAFARHLAVCGADVGGQLAEIHAEDLFLVGAALAHDAQAVGLLRAAHGAVIRAYLRRVEIGAEEHHAHSNERADA